LITKPLRAEIAELKREVAELRNELAEQVNAGDDMAQASAAG
jgi:hypothetical protein